MYLGRPFRHLCAYLGSLLTNGHYHLHSEMSSINILFLMVFSKRFNRYEKRKDKKLINSLSSILINNLSLNLILAVFFLPFTL